MSSSVTQSNAPYCKFGLPSGYLYASKIIPITALALSFIPSAEAYGGAITSAMSAYRNFAYNAYISSCMGMSSALSFCSGGISGLLSHLFPSYQSCIGRCRQLGFAHT